MESKIEHAWDVAPQYSRWRSERGALLVVLAKSWSPQEGVCVDVLDVRNERNTLVDIESWKRWVEEGRLKREAH